MALSAALLNCSVHLGDLSVAVDDRRAFAEGDRFSRFPLGGGFLC